MDLIANDHPPNTHQLRSATPTHDMQVAYSLRYVGCVLVKVSMKSLDFGARARVARQCIRRICAATGVLNSTTVVDNNEPKLLGSTDLLHSGSRVLFSITNERLRIAKMDAGDADTACCISSHDIANVSFASCGDSAALADYFAFVAKDADVQSNPPRPHRYCFVLHCTGVAPDVIADVGKAFAMRFHNMLCQSGAFDCLPPPPASVGTPPDSGNFFKFPDDRLDNNQSGSGEDSNASADDLIDLHSGHSSADPTYGKPWFFPNLNRAAAEALVSNVGDFLVRTDSRCDYVLTARADCGIKHVLLADDDGRIRMQETLFDSIEHFIDTYHGGEIPIVSATGVTLWLRSSVTNSW